MLNTKITKGKWSTKVEGDDRFVYSEQEGAVCRLPVAYGHGNVQEAESNAKLIAAAPELLEVLLSLNKALDFYWNSRTKGDHFIKEIEKYQRLSLNAIKKATE